MAKKSRQPTLVGFDEPQPVKETPKAKPKAAPSAPPRPRPARPEAQAPPSAPPTPPATHSGTSGSSSPTAGSCSSAAGSAGELAGKTVYLVDAHSLIYQVFHALPEMSGPSGQPVGAVHGFVRDLVDLIEVRGANYLVAALDHPAPTFRSEIYEDYKVHREEMPIDLALQIPVIERFLAALGIPTLSVEGYEADDILATLARQVEAAGGECLLVTSDKDCRQLITDRVKMYNIRKQEVFDAAALQATWGIRPDQVVDFQALVGDSVDNVPGVPLIGPKIAQELLAKYGTLENVLDHAHEISGAKRKENLMKGRELALKSRELVKLKTDVPITVDWRAARVGQFQPAQIEELCRECGFRQLARRIEALAVKLGAGTPSQGRNGDVAEVANSRDGSEVADGGQSPGAGSESPAAEPAQAFATLTTAQSPEWKANYRTIATPAELNELVALLAAQPQISLDTETTSIFCRRAALVGFSFAWAPGEAVYVPVRAPSGEPQLEMSLVLQKLKPVLENPSIAKLGQNLKFEQVLLRAAGIELAGVTFDTMVADYLLDPGERSHNLDELARRHLCHQTITIDQLIGSGKNQKCMDEVPVELITQYAAEDADVPLRLAAKLQPRLREQGLYELFAELEMPLIEVLAEMEFNGVRIDVARLRQLSGQFNDQIMRLEREIYEIAGREFNIDSRLQLAQLLFDELKLPVLKRTKTGPSMDADVLEDLAAMHPLPAKIIEYRQVAKLKSTYVDALPELIFPVTGRVHTSFKQDVAATGRLSSQDPNLQNIPIRTEQGRAIRSAFLPGPSGWLLMTADYSQIELRVLAHFSGDDVLRQAFTEDRDIHAQVASQVYGVPLEEVTSEMRRAAKAVNFGIIYGQSPFGLAKSLGIEQGDAALFIDRYFAQYPGVDRFMLETLNKARQDGFVTTISGRRRPVSGVRPATVLQAKRQRTLPERIAINTVIQGSAADIIKRAMIGVHHRLRREGLRAKLLLQIHDELVLEFPPEERERLTALIKEEMSTAAELSVPLKVDVKVGANWAECE